MIEMLSYGYVEILCKTNIIYLISCDTYWLIVPNQVTKWPTRTPQNMNHVERPGWRTRRTIIPHGRLSKPRGPDCVGIMLRIIHATGWTNEILTQREHAPPTDSYVLWNQPFNSVIGQVSKRSARTAGFHRVDVAMHCENKDLLLSCEIDLACMQASYANIYPRITQVSTISQDLLPGESTPATHQPETTHTPPTQKDGPLFWSELLNPNSNQPRSLHHAHSLIQLESPSHSLHAHSFIYPSWPSSRDGNLRTDMEWSLLRLLQRRDSEPCSHLNSPTGSHGVEPSDANSKFANMARTTTSTPSLSHAPNLCTSALVSAPLPSPRGASQSPIN